MTETRLLTATADLDLRLEHPRVHARSRFRDRLHHEREPHPMFEPSTIRVAHGRSIVDLKAEFASAQRRTSPSGLVNVRPLDR